MDDLRLERNRRIGGTPSATLSPRPSDGASTAQALPIRSGATLSAVDRDRIADAVADVLRRAIGLRPHHVQALATWIAEVGDTAPTGVAVPLPVAGPSPFQPAAPAPPDLGEAPPLTTREAQVLRRIVAGRSNKEIGVDLGIAERTAEVHVSNMMRKLGVSSRVEAATMGMRLGFDPEGGSGG